MRIRWRDFELPSRVVADAETASDTYSRFVVEPFERGFGNTVGNGLRRVLLSSIEGFAITQIKIEGVQHEFATLEGVLEDVVDIVLNAKGILVRLSSAGPVNLHLDVNREGEVKAGDIQCPADAEILNPDHVICTLTAPREFKMEFVAHRGRGYQTAEENEQEMEEKEIGVIAIDSNFSPVVRVRYKCEDTRVGKITNYDKLIFEVWTDGAVSPEAALVEAAKIYRKHLNPFIHYVQPAGSVLAGEEIDPLSREMMHVEEDVVSSPENEQPIAALDLSVRARNCLDAENIRTVGQLLQFSESDLLELRNFGQTSLKEVQIKLSSQGYTLKGGSLTDGQDDGEGDPLDLED